MNKLPLHQTGAALIVGLVMLLVMTMIGVSAMQTNLLEEKMAGNYRDRDLAFQAAEAALRDAEADIETSGRTNFDADEPKGVVLGAYTGTAPLALVACQPRYWIEGYLARPAGSSSWKAQYRITAVACGGSQTARVVLQEVYAP